MISLRSLAIATILASSALAQRTIQILAIQDLSLDDTFVFKPNSVTANVGDILEFHFAPTGFLPSGHSVAQGTFDRACNPMPNGFFSGTIAAEPNTALGEAPQVFRVQVTTTNPMVFYCATGEHCTRGMYGVVNPSSSQNLESYKATIPVNGAAVIPPLVQGGQLANNPGAIDPTTIPAGAGSLTVSMLGLVGAMAAAVVLG